MRRITKVAALVSALLLASCQPQQKPNGGAEKKAEKVVEAAFDADSAYSYVVQQCSFGPRTLGSKAHSQCTSYLSAKLQQLGASGVAVQRAKVRGWDDNSYEVGNIVAKFRPDLNRRVALFAHFDSRPYADKDADPNRRQKPIDGANDGASGVAVILEVARQYMLQDSSKVRWGIDVVFFDAEDFGEPSFLTGDSSEESWCLGSREWADWIRMQQQPSYGILLDMVGGKDAKFLVDDASIYFAADIAQRVWHTAAKLGYSSYFVNSRSGGLIDDHVNVNRIAAIPTIDIIDYDNERGFPETWHTSADVVENIDKQTLTAVGRTLLAEILR